MKRILMLGWVAVVSLVSLEAAWADGSGGMVIVGTGGTTKTSARTNERSQR